MAVIERQLANEGTEVQTTTQTFFPEAWRLSVAFGGYALGDNFNVGTVTLYEKQGGNWIKIASDDIDGSKKEPGDETNTRRANSNILRDMAAGEKTPIYRAIQRSDHSNVGNTWITLIRA